MSNEWYTPSKYIEAARSVMGSIDLDPASCELANQTVKATRYYTQEDDGLSKVWFASTLWLNPPYKKDEHGQSKIEVWTFKLLDQYKQGYVKQAILLIPMTQATDWFDSIWEYGLVCFPKRRIHFWTDGRNDWRPRFSSCFVYLGWNEQGFVEQFSQFGRIAKAIDVPVVKPQQLELVEAGRW